MLLMHKQVKKGKNIIGCSAFPINLCLVPRVLDLRLYGLDIPSGRNLALPGRKLGTPIFLFTGYSRLSGMRIQKRLKARGKKG